MIPKNRAIDSVLSITGIGGPSRARTDPTETYKLKKNEIFEAKLNLEDQIGKVSENGSAWLEPLKDFIETAANCGKIARAENNRKHGGRGRCADSAGAPPKAARLNR